MVRASLLTTFSLGRLLCGGLRNPAPLMSALVHTHSFFRKIGANETLDIAAWCVAITHTRPQ